MRLYSKSGYKCFKYSIGVTYIKYSIWWKYSITTSLPIFKVTPKLGILPAKVFKNVVFIIPLYPRTIYFSPSRISKVKGLIKENWQPIANC